MAVRLPPIVCHSVRVNVERDSFRKLTTKNGETPSSSQALNMLPVIALVGRPNVGKSTLFNRLTASRQALVADLPGLTRDRQYGYANLGGHRVLLVDTGGLAGEGELAEVAEVQTWQAVAEAGQILFLVDSRAGLSPTDERLGERLRGTGKPIWLLANKAEGLPPEALSEFHKLGFARFHPISARRGDGVTGLIETLVKTWPQAEDEPLKQEDNRLAVTIIGRPNVGKSTLINRLLGEERVLASAVPGTTRDAIRVPLERSGRKYLLIDTAGFRRRARVEAGAERLGVVAAISALENAMVAIVMSDASEGITAQDQRLIRLALERGRAVVIALNKWDGLTREARDNTQASAERRLGFAPFVRRVRLSALHGTGIGEMMAAVDEAGKAMNKEFTTGEVNRVLERLVIKNQPPIIRGRRIKLRYAHPAGSCPPRIVIHGSQVKRLPDTYRRYLAAGFREAFKVLGAPLILDFQSPTNPYVDEPRHSRGHTRRARSSSHR